jgi:nucleosome assembly protein 1-like 1
LKDISLEYLTDNPGFALIFTFAENEFFRNTILRKSYHLSKPEDEPGLSLMFDRAEGTIIEWKEGKNLAVTVEAKKQRHKGSQKTRIVKKTVPADTFFEFFTPMAYPEDDSSQDLDEDVMERIEGDYEAGEFIKEKLIPNSVGWFTGMFKRGN